VCKAFPHLRGRVPPIVFQFRFLGYKGIVVVDHVDRRLQGVKMRLRESQRVHDVDEAEFDIARSFDYPNLVHLNRLVAVSFLGNTNLFSRPVVMTLEDWAAEAQLVLMKRYS
jgi:hypothetical protein